MGCGLSFVCCLLFVNVCYALFVVVCLMVCVDYRLCLCCRLFGVVRVRYVLFDGWWLFVFVIACLLWFVV